MRGSGGGGLRRELFGIAAASFWTLLLLAVLSLVLWRTPFGNRLLATDGDLSAALSQDVRTNQIKTTAFVLCSMLAGSPGS